jgi:hypothetical protein
MKAILNILTHKLILFIEQSSADVNIEEKLRSKNIMEETAKMAVEESMQRKLKTGNILIKK